MGKSKGTMMRKYNASAVQCLPLRYFLQFLV